MFRGSISEFSMHRSFILIKKKISKVISGNSLKSEVVRGSFWLGSANGFEQLLRLIRNMILTRILLPEVFGLMAIIMAINVFFESFTEVGIRQAIIHSPEGEQGSYLNSAWWVSVFRSSFLYLITFILAPLASKFYHLPELTVLIRIAFLSIIFKGLMSPKTFVAIKNMEFYKWVLIFSVGGYIGIISTVILAFMIHNIWALVIGLNIEWLARLILSYFVAPFLPKQNIEKSAFRSLIRYSRGMVGLPILTFIFLRTDIFVIGKLCNAEDLGKYSLAVALASIPFRLVTKLISDIALPAFSRMQNDRERLRNAIMKLSSNIAIFIIPFFLFSVLYAKDMLHVIYGETYVQVAIPFSILIGTSVFRLISTPIAGLYMAIGVPSLHRFFTAIRAMLIILTIYPAIKWFGLVGAASAGFISMCVSLIFQVTKLARIIDLNPWSYARIFQKGFVLSIVIFTVWIFSYNSLSVEPFVNLLLGLSISIVIYLLLIYILLNSKYKLSLKIN